MEASGTSLAESLVFAGTIPYVDWSDSELKAVLVELAFAPQEDRIVRLICQGYGDKQIAAKLGIKFGTERTYLSRAFARVGVSGRMELVSVVLNRILSNRKAEEK